MSNPKGTTYKPNPLIDGNEHLMMGNENYKEYLALKKKIRDKYPKELLSIKHIPGGNIGGRENKMYKNYISEISNLMFKRNGPFDKFLRDIEEE